MIGPLLERAGLTKGWRFTAESSLRAAAIAVAALVLAYAGALAAPYPPWTALALPAGLALAGTWRWGRNALAGAAVGLYGALVGLGHSWISSGGAVLAVVGAVLMIQTALLQLHFDSRLQRAVDVLRLVLAVACAGALPVAGVVALGRSLAGRSGVDVFGDFAAGWVVLMLGMLACTVAICAVDPNSLAPERRIASRRRTYAGAAALLGLLWLMWIAPGTRWAVLVLFVPHLVVLTLALRGQLALAAGGLLLVALLGCAQASHGAALWTTGGGAAPLLLLGWLGSALLAMLLGHAATAEWRGRSQRWEWALDGSRLGVADWHLDRSESFASSAWRSITGQGGPGWSPAHWQAQAHPDDQPLLAEAIAALTGGGSGRRRLELRLPHGSGWRWTEATLLVIEREAGGRPVRLLATLADVQDRHDAQERQLMSVSLFQHLHEGLLITDPDLRALDVNAAYSQILGVPRDEVLGTVPSLLRPAPADPIARQQRAAMWASLRDQGSWRGELLERRRNGELCTLQATISTVRGPEQDLRYHVLVISDITEQQAQREQLERQAHYDELTRLPNRAHLSQLLDEAIRAVDRDSGLLVVCYLDLDRFKPVNDRYGHAAGDRLLTELAGRLRSALRSRELGTDSAARLGGDEFVLLLRAGTLDEARLAVNRVLRVVSEPYVIDPAQDSVQITASMGVTAYPIDRSDADTLLRHADQAMYSAKQAGRNGYAFFDTEGRRRDEQQRLELGRIQEGLDRHEFVLYYQPKVDMRNSRVLGFEALLRWEHPKYGLVAPGQFLHKIENTGLSARIGDWVLAQALDHLSQWRSDGLDISVSVNISARHLQEPDFAQRLSELLARHSEPLARSLELEMLETAAHEDVDATSALVSRCQGLGVRFALDDFGTGYSTLTYLKKLPVDVLKIDQSFVHSMLDDSQDRAIVEGVIGLARTFGCTVVAEGVESPAQARTLLELGCDIGQGTGIAAPMPSSAVMHWVRDYRGMFALASAANGEGDAGGDAKLAG